MLIRRTFLHDTGVIWRGKASFVKVLIFFELKETFSSFWASYQLRAWISRLNRPVVA